MALAKLPKVRNWTWTMLARTVLDLDSADQISLGHGQTCKRTKFEGHVDSFSSISVFCIPITPLSSMFELLFGSAK
eukprot:3323812-Amphidinium_carterae.1